MWAREVHYSLWGYLYIQKQQAAAYLRGISFFRLATEGVGQPGYRS